MQIIIVGCGKVGRTLAEQLQEEDTDITLIDINPDRINAITDEVDAMGRCWKWSKYQYSYGSGN